MPTAADIVTVLQGAAAATPGARAWTYALIASPYTSGQPKLVFDEDGGVATTKTYFRLASYTPVAGDRVMVLLDGPTALILGKIV